MASLGPMGYRRRHPRGCRERAPRPRYTVGYMAGLLVALNRFLPAWLLGQVATSQIT